jgi:hypothetical protein
LNTQYQTRDQNGDDWQPYLVITATLPGDVNNDGSVNVFDVIDTVTAFGSTPASGNWNPEADFDCSLSVNVFDVIDAVTHFGQVVVP